MFVLGGWSAANIAYSGIQWGRTTGETQAFHQMNTLWTSVNLGIAGLAYWGVRKEQQKTYGLTETLRKQSSTEKVLWFNTGLDAGYMAAGLYLMERGNGALSQEDQDRFRGWGKSLVLQGGFLFTYDLIFVLLQERHGRNGVIKFLETVQPVGLGLGINIPIGGSSL